MKITASVTLCLLTVFATFGCANTKVADEQFGSSVRNLVKYQTYDPYTLRSPSKEQPTGQNSQKAMLDKHRIYRTSDVSKSETKAPRSTGGGES